MAKNAQLSETFPVRMAANGRMVLPAPVRKAMGIVGESQLFVEVENGVVRLESIHDRVRRAQALYRKHAKTHRTVDDFLADRRLDDAKRDAVLSGVVGE